MTKEKKQSHLGILISLLIGAFVIWAGSSGSTQSGAMPLFALCGVLAFVINWVAFVPANHAKTELYYDLTGSITYLSVVTLAVMLAADLDTRAWIVAAMVWVWALRLGSFLFRRVRRDGGDGRFDAIKTDPLRFLMAWTLQGLWVLLTAACALAIITSRERPPIGLAAIVGIAVWLAGFTIEVVADHQKSAFRKDPANARRFITSGLWAWSRHPNYFGEITLWLGIAIIALPLLSGWRWAMLVSPAFVYLLITRVSGVPLLRARAEQRWGHEEAFQTYIRNTPSLIPRSPRR